MTHAINRVFPVLILTGYSLIFSLETQAAEETVQPAAGEQ